MGKIQGYGKHIISLYMKSIAAKMTATQGFIPLFMFYISRHEWDISLLTLLYSEDIDVVKFVAGITKGAECKISFEYNNTNIKKWDGTEIEGFIEN